MSISTNLIASNTFNFGSGVFRNLLEQSNNSSTNIKIKLASTQDAVGYGNWSSGSIAYFTGDLRAYPSGSQLVWRCKSDHTSSPSNAPWHSDLTIDSHWEMATAIDMIQDSGDGIHFFRTTMQFPGASVETPWNKMRKAEYGTIQLSPITFGRGNYNIDKNYWFTSTSNTVPSAVGDTRTFTISAGLGILAAPVTLRSCSTFITIPSNEYSLFNLTLPSGKNLTPGRTFTLYSQADPTNIMVMVTCRYNNTTGACYAFCTKYNGSGTFNDWTAIKEDFHLMARDNDLTKNTFCVVQSYNSGTGSITIKNIKSSGGGSGPYTNWFGQDAKVPYSDSLTSAQSRSFNYDITAIGSWFTGQFMGTGHAHHSQIDNRGTGVIYVYTGGPDAPNESDSDWAIAFPANKVVDTYSASLFLGSSAQSFSGLTEGRIGTEHKFIAISKPSSNGSSTNTQFWIDASTDITKDMGIDYIYDSEIFIKDTKAGILGFAGGDPQSEGKQIAIYKELSHLGDDFNTEPYHGDHTENSVTKIHSVDGITINTSTHNSITNPYLYRYKSFKSARCIQSGSFLHEQRVGDFIRYKFTTHSFDRHGVKWSIPLQFVKDCKVDQLYSILKEMSERFFVNGSVISDNGQLMKAPTVRGTPVAMTSQFAGQRGYVAIGNDNQSIGWYYDNPVQMWRIGASDVGQHEIEFRVTGSSGGGFKLRTRPMFNGQILTGEIYNMNGRFYAGNSLNVVYDPSYLNWLNYITTQGYSLPSANTLDAMNTWFKRMRSKGLLRMCDLFYWLATDGDANVAKVNLINPGAYTLVANGSPVFTSKLGFRSGVSGYLDTQFKLNTNRNNISLNNLWSGIYLNENVSAIQAPYGSEEPNKSYYHALANSANLEIPHVNVASSGGANGPIIDIKGAWDLNRTATGTSKSFYGGNLSLNSSSVSTAMNNINIYLLALNDSSSGAINFTDSNMGWYFLASADDAKIQTMLEINADCFAQITI